MQIFTKNQTEAIKAEIIPNVSKRVFVYTLQFFFQNIGSEGKRQCRKQYKTWWIIFAILPI